MRPRTDLLDMLYDLLGMLAFISYALLVVIIVLRVVMTRRAIGVSLAWLTLIFTIPILGISLYLLFGEIRLGRKRVERARAMYEPYARWISELVSHFPRQPAMATEGALASARGISANWRRQRRNRSGHGRTGHRKRRVRPGPRRCCRASTR